MSGFGLAGQSEINRFANRLFIVHPVNFPGCTRIIARAFLIRPSYPIELRLDDLIFGKVRHECISKFGPIL
jgi:hypothetical protein